MAALASEEQQQKQQQQQQQEEEEEWTEEEVSSFVDDTIMGRVTSLVSEEEKHARPSQLDERAPQGKVQGSCLHFCSKVHPTIANSPSKHDKFCENPGCGGCAFCAAPAKQTKDLFFLRQTGYCYGWCQDTFHEIARSPAKMIDFCRNDQCEGCEYCAGSAVWLEGTVTGHCYGWCAKVHETIKDAPSKHGAFCQNQNCGGCAFCAEQTTPIRAAHKQTSFHALVPDDVVPSPAPTDLKEAEAGVGELDGRRAAVDARRQRVDGANLGLGVDGRLGFLHEVIVGLLCLLIVSGGL